MDNRCLLVEAIVAGEKGYYECPLQLRLYGTNDPVARENLIAQMRSSGLPTCTVQNVNSRAKQEAQQREKNEKERRKVAAQAAKQARKNGSTVVDLTQQESGMGEFTGGSARGIGPGPSLEDIVGASERFNPRNAEQYVEEFGIQEKDLVSFIPHHLSKGLLT